MATKKKLLEAAAGGAEVDEFFNQTTLLLHGDGTNGAQNNTFLDSSTNNFTITRTGNATQGSFNPYTAAYSTAVDSGSGYFDGTGDYLTVPINSAFNFGSIDFTIEGWINVPSVDATYRTIFSIGPPVQIYARSGTIEVYFNDADNTSTYIVNGTTGPAGSITANTWHHFAVVRSGTTFTVYVDGVDGTAATGVTASVATSATAPAVGIYLLSTSLPYTGYIADFRVVNGTAVYTAAFTPPTAPLTAISGTELLCNFTNAGIFDSTAKNVLETVGNAQIDTSVVKYGTGSMEFDGTGDYLSVPSNPDLVLGTGDFTIEFWVYFDAVSDSTIKYLYDFRNASATSSSFLAQENTNGWTYYNGAASPLATGWTSGTFTTGTWYHIAICRSSGTTRFFVDGTSTSSVADTSNYANGTFVLASRYNGQDFLNGYIDDLRITKGVARYTAAFTPPERALPSQ